MNIEVTEKNYRFIRKLKSVKYNGKVYEKVEESQIGDIALCVNKTAWTKEGNYYLVVECYPPNGFKGIIADDNKPMGIHDNLNHFEYYRCK